MGPQDLLLIVQFGILFWLWLDTYLSNHIFFAGIYHIVQMAFGSSIYKLWVKVIEMYKFWWDHWFRLVAYTVLLWLWLQYYLSNHSFIEEPQHNHMITYWYCI